jgi:hypothetical protein
MLLITIALRFLNGFSGLDRSGGVNGERKAKLI